MTLLCRRFAASAVSLGLLHSHLKEMRDDNALPLDARQLARKVLRYMDNDSDFFGPRTRLESRP